MDHDGSKSERQESSGHDRQDKKQKCGANSTWTSHQAAKVVGSYQSRKSNDCHVQIDVHWQRLTLIGQNNGWITEFIAC